MAVLSFVLYVVENKFEILYKSSELIKEVDFPNFLPIFEMEMSDRDNMFIKAISRHAKTIPKRFANETDMKLIILAMTDNSFFDMALNLYMTSFKRFNITNFLFVGAGNIACRSLLELNIQCFYFTEDKNSNESNLFGSLKFVRKMNIRTDMIIKALRANFSVLHTDIDVVFLNNPMPYVEKSLKAFNMAILWDYSVYNAGFLAIKPTQFSLEVYLEMQYKTNKSASLDDQTALNSAIGHLRKKYKNNPQFSSVGVLDKSKFLCGKSYYEVVDRNFPTNNGSNNCPGCLVVHNNWIVTMEAKVYRFKESLMWVVDKNGYYSDNEKKYLLYNNPYLTSPPANFSTEVEELNALKTAFALAQMLNRTLILPRFHCLGPKNPRECSILHWVYVRTLDAFFEYRENSFLSNALVPQSIKKDLSQQCPYGTKQIKISIKENLCSPKLKNDTTGCLEPVWNFIDTKDSMMFNDLVRYSFDRGVSLNFRNYSQIPERELLNLLNGCDDQVLYVASLLGVQVVFDEKSTSEKFNAKIKDGIKRKNYLQY
ncbi:hypothetical protein HELRODRAFT_170433 [Helobdella robusta]|uniref:Nucleotide-diphospho-sugar transferase domain-containing protein n=1 Tax=Helobdella robusta TaxID=6412 RepID=T1F321_HELRO|nr:hypothetical protein HELRODRAFT_170433 [Helobdella robusta]ESO07131.1 hypothetical protein HELRODRAFT_170433 [Helobdella robusta]